MLVSKEAELDTTFISQRFKTIDYIICALLLSLSALIGIYYGFIAKRKQNNTAEYILGSRSMSLFPIAVSMIVSNISGMTILGYPVDIYLYGTQISVASWTSTIVIILAINYIYLPVFYEIQNQSCYVYLERRFDKRVKLLASTLYTISVIFFLPVVIFIPSIALNQVTGINIHVISALGCGICVFYTTIGGLRAVVWTDALQYILMMGAIVSVMYLGNEAVGGIANTWAAAERGHRLEFFNFDWSPFPRTTFWSTFIGMTIHLLGNIGISPVLVQRCLSLSSKYKARWSVWICFIGMAIFFNYALITGLQMYAKYERCDPFLGGIVKSEDQTLSLFVLDVAKSIPGLSGLFISGVLAAALSTISSSLNTLAGTIYEDFLKSNMPLISEKRASTIMKFIVLALGATIAVLAVIVEKMGPVFQVAVILGGIGAGSLLGLFTLGMTTRTANSIGAIFGGIVSIAVVGFTMVGAQILGTSKKPALPLRTDGCITNTTSILEHNITPFVLPTPDEAGTEIFWLFRISFIYYSTIGFLVAMVVGYIVSLLTGGRNQYVDNCLLTPLIRSKTK